MVQSFAIDMLVVIEATADDAEKILRVINNKIKPADVGGRSYTYYTHYKNMHLYYYRPLTLSAG
jgi:hypothetical protein